MGCLSMRAISSRSQTSTKVTMASSRPSESPCSSSRLKKVRFQAKSGATPGTLNAREITVLESGNNTD